MCPTKCGPRENKTLVRFVNDYLRKYIGLINVRDGPASPSIRLINPINFRRQSVTNLISNNIHKYESYKVHVLQMILR